MELYKGYRLTVGLEVHAELKTKSKIFCSCSTAYGSAPGENCCHVCTGMPGALPVPNERAIEYIVMAGIATNCEVMRRSMFYRKHYFYPDMAKNFQTTQGPVAFVMHGHLDLEVTGAGARERRCTSPRCCGPTSTRRHSTRRWRHTQVASVATD